MSEKFAFICSEEGNYPMVKMCKWLGVSTSGYYVWKKRTPSATARRRSLLTTLVKASFRGSDGTYGYRRVHADLVFWGYPCCEDTVRDIMRELGLVACQPRPYKTTTIPGEDPNPVVDLVKRDFTATAPRRSSSGTSPTSARGRLGVPGHRHRLLLEDDHRLRPGRSHAHLTGDRRPFDGHP